MMYFFIQMIVSIAISLLLAPKVSFDEAEASTLDDWNFPSSADKPIPVIFGKVLHTSMNDTWHGDYEPKAITEKVKTGMFSSKNVVTGHKYYLGMQAALCYGDDTLKLHNIYSGETQMSPLPVGGWDGKTELVDGFETFYIGVEADESELANKLAGNTIDEIEGVEGQYSFKNGYQNTQSSYLSKHLDINPAYEGLAYVVFEKFMWGESASLPAFSFELSRYPKNTTGELTEQCVIGEDANPAYVIYEVFTNDMWGMAMPSAYFNLSSFESIAQTLYDEELGVSMTVSSVSTASTIIAEMLRTTDACIIMNRSTGLFEVRLIRDDYKTEDLTVLDMSSVIEVQEYTKAALDKLISELRVSFTSRDNLYESRSVADQNLGVYHSRNTSEFKDLTYSALTTYKNASKVARRDLVALSSDLASLKANCTREAANLDVGDAFVFKFDPLSIVQQVYRVTSINRGNIRSGSVSVSATTDTFGMAYSAYSSANESEYSTYSRMPTAANNIEFIEGCYWLGQDSAQFYALVEKPSTAESGFELKARTVGLSTYNDVEGTYAFTQRAVISSADNDTIIVDGDYTAYVESVSDADLKAGVNLSLIVSDEGQEWVVIKSAVYDLETQKTSLTVWRGCLDTVVKSHANAVLWFVDEAGQVVDYDFDSSSEMMVRTRTSVALQSVDEASVRTAAIANKRKLPLPVASAVAVETGGGVQVGWVRKGEIGDVQPANSVVDVDSGWSYEVTILDGDDDVVATKTVQDIQVTFGEVSSLNGLKVKIVSQNGSGQSEAVWV